ncbi:MAG: four helix bundle protein [Dehalococcoidia bacterium]
MTNNKPANQQTSRPASSPRVNAYNYRNLDVWEMAQNVAADVILLTRDLPRDAAALAITRQMVRSAGSIGANIAEGHGRYSLGAYKNHLSIAKGSACETDSWLDLLKRTGLIAAESEQRLHERMLSLIALLTSKIRALEEKARQTVGIREDAAEYFTAGDEIDE